MNIIKLAAWLLLISGILLLVPGFYDWFTELTKGTPWIQIFIGLLSIVVAGVIIFKKLYNHKNNKK